MSARPFRLWPWILIPLAAVTALVTFVVLGFLATGAAGPYPWPWWGFFPWFPFVGIWIFFGFLFLVFAFRGVGGSWGSSGGWSVGSGDESGTILRERYARGELTREQFLEMRRALEEHRMENAYDEEAARTGGP